MNSGARKQMKQSRLINRRVFCKFLLGFLITPQLYAQQNRPLQIAQERKPANDILVWYYSLTQNTEMMAKAIASRYKADLVGIKAEEYSSNFLGSFIASIDAWTEERTTTVHPESIDLSRYRYIFLGSPIWWFRPAVPLWTIVERNKFQNQDIILFNTFNSRFKDEYIDEFAGLVNSKGGNFSDHIFIRRGRWYNQLNRQELAEQIQTLLESRESRWNFKSEQNKNNVENASSVFAGNSRLLE